MADEHDTWSDDPMEPPTHGVSSASRYEIGRLLGKGGLGRVYLARDRVLDRDVALKELRRNRGVARARFAREMRVTARLQHPAIVPVHDAGEQLDRMPFYTMKAVEGRSLDQVVADAETSRDRVALLPHVIAVCEAIAYAHSEGVVHRDLKPQNILVGAFGETLVIDWGLAKPLDAPELEPGESLPAELGEGDSGAGLTVDGSVLGTPGYMPPEQARGEPVDRRSDVFALGALLYVVLTGSAPYDQRSSEDRLEHARRAEYLPLRERDADLPPDLDAIVTKAMQAKPDDRYPSAAELAADLKRFQTGQLVGAYDYSLAEQLTRWLVTYRVPVGIAAIAGVLLAGMGVLTVQAIVDREQQAQAARAREQARADEIGFEQARLALDSNPVRSLALLDGLSDGWTRWAAAATVAADAVSRGLPRPLGDATGAVVDIVVSPDGQRVAAGGVDRTIRIHDVASGAAISRLIGSTEPIGVVRFSPDGTRVAGASDTIGRVWDVDSGRLLHELPGAADIVAAVQWSGDGRWLASPSYDGSTRVWSATDGSLVHELAGHDDAVLDAAFSADGALLLTAGYDERAVLWDPESGVELRRWTTSEALQAVTAAPDKPTFALFGESATIWLADAETGALRALSAHEDWIQDVAWSPDGTRLASASLDRSARVWDAATGEVLAVLHGHDGSVESVSFAPDGALITAGSDGRVVRFSSTFSRTHVMRGHEQAAYAVAAGSAVVSADLGGTVLAWTLDRSDVRRVRAYDLPVGGLTFGPGGLATVDEGGHAHVGGVEVTVDVGTVFNLQSHDDTFAIVGTEAVALVAADGTLGPRLEGTAVPAEITSFLEDGRVVRGLEDGTLAVLAVDGTVTEIAVRDATIARVDAAGDLVAVATYDGAVSVVTLSTDPPGVRLLGEHPTPALEAVFSLDGDTIFSVGGGGDVRAWPVDGSEGWLLAGATYINVWLRSGPQDHLAGGDAIGAVQVWADPREPPRTLIGHTAGVQNLMWHPDGTRLVTAGEDGTSRVWWLGDEQPIHRALVGHGGPVDHLAWSPDGHQLATGGEDGHVLLWDDDFPTEPATLRARIATELGYGAAGGDGAP